MSYKTYRMIQALIIVVMAFLAAWVATSDNWLLLIPVMVVFGAILFFLRRKVTEVVVDERVNIIAGKASRLSFVVFVMLAVISAAILIYLGKDSSDVLFNIGLTLDFAACALMVLYWAAYFYYNRKLGGK
jgi:uncharacterized membrane protein